MAERSLMLTESIIGSFMELNNGRWSGVLQPVDIVEFVIVTPEHFGFCENVPCVLISQVSNEFQLFNVSDDQNSY